MREKGKRLIAIILSCLLLLSNVTVYAATEAEEQSDTQNTVSVNACKRTRENRKSIRKQRKRGSESIRKHQCCCSIYDRSN